MSRPVTRPLLLDFPEEFHSQRLTIRAPLPGDGAALNAAIQETADDLAEWLPWAKTLPTPEESEENLRGARADFLAREDLRLLLLLKDSETFVGGSGLHRIDWSVPAFEIGYWCRKRYQGQGYIREAVARITQFAFTELAAARVEIRCDARNTQSWKIPEALGFVLEGTLRHNSRANDGSLRDTRVYAKLADGDTED